MCSSQFISQPSWNLDEYLPIELPSEETLLYQSSEDLLRSFNTNTLPSAHRMETELFDPIYDDIEALSALTMDDLFLINNIDSESDDLSEYFQGRSTVIPHTPNLSTETQLHVSFPLSPSSTNMYKNEQSNMSSRSSPLHSNRVHGRKFHVFDQISGRERRPYLHEFLRLLLENDEYSHIIQYIDRKQGIFKLQKPNEIAELWARAKGRTSDFKMTYDKLARALRYYYSSGIMQPNPGRFTFRFGVKSGFGTTWWPAY